MMLVTLFRKIVETILPLTVEEVINRIKERKRETLEDQLFICMDKSLMWLCEKYNCEYDLKIQRKFLENVIRNAELSSQNSWEDILRETIYISIDDRLAEEWFAIVNRVIAEEQLIKLRDYIFLSGKNDKESKKTYPRILTVKPAMPPEEYVDRAEYQEICAKLQESRKLVLVNGIGGIGKSTVCRKLFHELEKKKEITLAWIIYKDKNLLEDLCQQLLYPRKGKAWKERFIQFLQQDIEENAVIFVDNVNRTEEEEPFLEILSNANCNVICTSRVEKFEYYEAIHIDFMDESDCIQLLYKYYKLERDDDIALRIVRRAGFHTLTIEILGKIGNAENYSLEELEVNLEKKGFDLEGIASVEHKEDTLIGHLCRTFDTSKLTDSQKKILYCLAILPAQWIPLQFRDWLGFHNNYNFNYLIKHAWFVRNDAGFYMHPVIKEVVKRLVSVSEDILYVLLEGLEKELSYQESPDYEASMLRCSFADAILQNISRKDRLVISEIYYDMSVIYGQFGEYLLAKVYIENCMKILKHGEQSELLLSNAYNHKGYICYYLFQDTEAESCYKEAYAIRKKFKNKKLFAQSASSLALLYQGMWDAGADKQSTEAKRLLALSDKYQKEAIKIFEKIFHGTMQSNMASAYNNMAVLKNSQGDYEQAIYYYRKAEKIRLQLPNGSAGDLSVTYLGLCNSYMDRAAAFNKNIYKLHNYKMALLYLEKGKDLRLNEIRGGNQKLSVEEMEKKEATLLKYIRQLIL